ERANLLRLVRTEDGRVVPVGPPERRRDDILPRLVEEGGAGVIVGGPPGPRRHELLVRLASQEDRLTSAHNTGDGGAHLRIERIVERPGRTVHDAIQRDEFVYEDAAHDGLLGCGEVEPNGSHHRPGTAKEIIVARARGLRATAGAAPRSPRLR